jgi:hypothetical protein
MTSRLTCRSKVCARSQQRFALHLLRTVAAFLLVMVAMPAFAEQWTHVGLLRARDLTPFGLLRLDMRPSHMRETAPGSWGFEVQAAYQNTFMLSDNVEEYLETRDSGRIKLRPEDAQAIRLMPEDAYYVDGEIGLLDLILHRRLTERVELLLDVTYLRYGDGEFDHLIESFHDLVGTGQMGRDLVARDRFQIVYHVADAYLEVLDRQVKGGFGDPVLGLRYSWPNQSSQWSFVFEAAAKIAVGGRRFLLSTGHHDFGIQGTAQRRFGRHSLYGSVSTVYFSGGLEMPTDRDQLIPTLVVAYSFSLTPGTAVILQGYASRSAVRDTTLDELEQNKYQASLGMQMRTGRWIWSLAITENIANFANTPDIGAQVGLAYAQ